MGWRNNENTEPADEMFSGSLSGPPFVQPDKLSINLIYFVLWPVFYCMTMGSLCSATSF